MALEIFKKFVKFSTKIHTGIFNAHLQSQNALVTGYFILNVMWLAVAAKQVIELHVHDYLVPCSLFEDIFIIIIIIIIILKLVYTLGSKDPED